MVFTDPVYLFGLLALPLFWLYPKGERDGKHAALRALVLTFLFLALARPVLLSDEEEPVHVFLVDQSNSVQRGSELAQLAEVARELPTTARAHLVLVAERDALDATALEPFASVRRLSPRASGSPLAEALTTAAALIPRGASGSITMVSDGMATTPGWERTVQSLVERGTPVHTRKLELPQDVYPVQLRAEGLPRVGHTARFVARIAAQAARVDLSLRDPSGEVAALKEVVCEGVTEVVLEFEPSEEGFVELTLEVEVLEGSNALTTNDSLKRTFAVQPPVNVLYLGERMAGGASTLESLVGPGFELQSWNSAEGVTGSFAGHDLVILDDIPASSFPEEVQADLVSAVRDEGVGLFVSGGQAAFGAGGYHDQPLEEILPVEFVQKEEKRDPSTTLVVIIDTSGSMGGNRVQLAKEVARLSIRRLLPHDKVGIVEFYGAKHWAAPIQPASNAIELERALNRLDAGGGTVILPAIEEAFYGLKNVQTRYKHVLVLTDGGVETGAFEPLLRNMANDGINVSTVLIGPEAHSEFLVTLANWGKGRFYSVPNRFNLPEILLKQPASAKLPSYRPGTHVVQARGGAGWWGGVELESVPALAGYVETRDRPGAEVLLETREGGHTVLGSWRYGLGRVTAFTSEPTGPGTEPWKDWDGFGPWLARLFERTAGESESRYQLDLERDARGLAVLCTNQSPRGEGMAWSLRDGEDPTGSENEGAYSQAGDSLPAGYSYRDLTPRQFELFRRVDPVEEVRLQFEAGSGESLQRTYLVSPARDGIADEHQVDPDGRLDLSVLSSVTGGTILASDAALVNFTPATGVGANPLSLVRVWPWFALLSLLTYLFEIFMRRRDSRGAARS